jgi:hypothetical protein
MFIRLARPFLFLPLLCLALPASGQPAAPPAGLTSEQDHRRMLNLLGIEELREGANGMDRTAPNAANYDETKATVYPDLPDPLRFNDGRAVRTLADWQRRRAELFELFDREIYGRVPDSLPPVDWKTISLTKEMRGDVPVTTRRLVGEIVNPRCQSRSVAISLRLTTPADAAARVPVMMDFGFPEGFRFPGMTGPLPPEFSAWMDQVLARGWGYAVVVPMSIQPDNGAGLTSGIIGLASCGQPRDADDWGALRAWAWGASRALDYLRSDPAVDGTRVGIEGLSRYGKAALVTMAYDPRFAIGLIGSSGEGGAKLHRRDFGERVENVASSGEYHWMAGNFLKYAGPLHWNDLPVDQHELIALVAPRPLFIGAGNFEQDPWVDPKGSFLAAKAAGPVYALLGRKGVAGGEYEGVGTEFLSGDIAFRQHSGGHTNAPNWDAFLTFAERYFGSVEAPTASGK